MIEPADDVADLLRTYREAGAPAPAEARTPAARAPAPAALPVASQDHYGATATMRCGSCGSRMIYDAPHMVPDRSSRAGYPPWAQQVVCRGRPVRR